MINKYLKGFLFASALLLLGALNAISKPNVVVILADDFGIGSVNAYGAPKALVRTPNIDRLAESGMRFMDASAPASICSPTRYAMLTGEYAWRGPLPFAVVNVDDPAIILPDNMTVARYFQENGYATAQVGKWHLGYGSEFPVNYLQRLSPGPNDIGFDYHFGLPQNLDDRLRVWIENDRIYGLRSNRISPYGLNYYREQYSGFDAPQRSRETAAEYMTDKAVDWIRRTHRGNPQRPFFLYFAPAAMHHPIVPSEEMRGSSAIGAYGDFIHDLDHSVGRIISALEYEGILENTLIIFSSDNGADFPPNDPRNLKPENQARAMGLKANADYRGDKHTIYQGGIRVPLIVRWDGRVKAGSTSEHVVSLVDLFATLTESVLGKTPTPEQAPDSISFAAILFGEQMDPRPPMITSSLPGLLAVRAGDWKFIDGKFPQGVHEPLLKRFASEGEPALFNLRDDPGETTNVISKYPEVARKMQDLIEHLRNNPTRR